MNPHDCDIAIIGGGLAGGLIALALARHRPDMAVRLIEAGPRPGGNHRWSWFSSDVSPQGQRLLAPVHKAEWQHGYDVRFPARSRTLGTPYNSIGSADFAAALERELPAGTIMCSQEVTALDAGGVDLKNGKRVAAKTVIDCRGLAGSAHLRGGWQVFMGRHLHTAQPHGISRPIIMDASVVQHDGYRFVYVLPLGAHELFVEDTYYNDGPALDGSVLTARLDDYCAAHGWAGDIMAAETGVLPVITGGDFAAFQQGHRIKGVAVAGARGGFVHPLTSYTLPFAVQTALTVAAHADLTGEQLASRLEDMAQQHWRQMGFYRMLGSMLFGAAHPQDRYRVFQRFYGLAESLVERFYAGRSTTADKARILCGRPPVPIGRAIAALAGAQPPLIPHMIPHTPPFEPRTI